MALVLDSFSIFPKSIIGKIKVQFNGDFINCKYHTRQAV
ncbi:hypothetical protein CCACVL1_04082 [Corchorus capsularis]|uniref:Uncharacterized protein n=1 Tax=Corchorus capsularis TaxID=210143 RepID=A0A1R3JV23_COCAP|nr:hypothetical protein CCACVL1_04082 [Corchorus capsularis]